MERLVGSVIEYAAPSKRWPHWARVCAAGGMIGAGFLALLFLWGDGNLVIACFADPPGTYERFGALTYLEVHRFGTIFVDARTRVEHYSDTTFSFYWGNLGILLGVSVVMVAAVAFFSRRLLRR